jgi:hypothetical protein
VQLEEPLMECLPLSQSWQTPSMLLIAFEYRPAGQFSQDRSGARKVPESHAGVGAEVGVVVGNAVGWVVGVAVGNAVGETVGVAVGNAVGKPVGMAEHSVWPVAVTVHWPAAQASHSVYDTPWNLPTGQWKQLVLPVHALYWPSAQASQASPVVAWNWPIGQSVHAEARAIANVPLAQTEQDTAL